MSPKHISAARQEVYFKHKMLECRQVHFLRIFPFRKADKMRTRFLPKFLTAAVAATVLLGGVGSAQAVHPPVQLFTFEEVATQYGMDGMGMPMPVMIMDTTSMKGMPFSPKMSCGSNNMNDPMGANGCHDYNKTSDHAFHSAQGMFEWKDTADGQFLPITENAKPWTQGTAMYGKW
jgi:hypothetical protein